MSKKIIKIFCVTLVVVLLVGIGCFIYVSGSQNEVGIEEEIINFKTPGFVVELVKGKPDDIIDMSESDAKGYKYYNQSLFGENGDITYYSNVGVYKVKADIYVSSDKIDERFEYICQYMKNIYSDKSGFYDNGLVTTDSMGFPMYNMGTKENGNATGIVVTIILNDMENEINISAGYCY